MAFIKHHYTIIYDLHKCMQKLFKMLLNIICFHQKFNNIKFMVTEMKHYNETAIYIIISTTITTL